MKHQTILKALQSLYKSFRWDDLDLFYGKINLHAFKWGNRLNVIKWVETCYDNTNEQIYFYENIKTRVVVSSCLGGHVHVYDYNI